MASNCITNEQREAIVRKAIAERDAFLAENAGFGTWTAVAVASGDQACTVCGKQQAEHGGFPTCSSHPYSPNGRCGHVGALVGGKFVGAPCAGAECLSGCAAASFAQAPNTAAPAPVWQTTDSPPPDGVAVLVRWPDTNPEADVPWRYGVARHESKRALHHWWSAESSLPHALVVSPSHWQAIAH